MTTTLTLEELAHARASILIQNILDSHGITFPATSERSYLDIGKAVSQWLVAAQQFVIEYRSEGLRKTFHILYGKTAPLA